MAWGTMSRERVVDKATEMVVTRGYDHFTLRALSDALGTAPMSLYRHVRNKDDLLVEVVDRLLADAWVPRNTAPEDGQRWLVEVADRLRAFLVEQPAALHVYLARPVTSPTAIVRMEAVLTVLRRMYGGERRAQSMYAAMHTYTLGFAALEAARTHDAHGGGTDDALAAQLATYTSPRRFAEGLRFLLAGGLAHGHVSGTAGSGPGGQR
jgi:AcrR family transcriptional regulator